MKVDSYPSAIKSSTGTSGSSSARVESCSSAREGSWALHPETRTNATAMVKITGVFMYPLPIPDAGSDYHADRFYFPASVEAVAGHLYVAEFKFPNRTLVFSE